MRIFVSYSFRAGNEWVKTHVEPLIRCFGHTPVTGRILDAEPLPVEVRDRIKGCQRVLCFVTRAAQRYGPNGADGWSPPDWVRDELMMARGQDKLAIEFREAGVTYGGAAPFYAWHDFDRTDLGSLLLRVAEVVSQWPVGPLQLRLSVPDALKMQVEAAANGNHLKATCVAYDQETVEVSREELMVRLRDDRLVVPFWVKPDPNLAIEIEITLGAQRLAARGISPSVREARLELA